MNGAGGMYYQSPHAGTSSSSHDAPAPRPTSSGFLWNGRVALALLPSLAVLASYGGGLVAGALLVGSMGVYILDAMGHKEGAFGAAWLTMGTANVAMVGSILLYSAAEQSLLLTLLVLLLSSATLALAGLWATLQFRWIQLQYPSVVMAFERMLIAGCLPVCGTVLTWGLAASAGMENAPFYLAGLMCLLYYLFVRPLPSSFHLHASARRTAIGGAGPAKVATLQDGGDAFAAFLLATCLPAGVYAATHAAVLAEHWVHLWSLLLLGSGPLLFVMCLKDGLWWLGQNGGVDALRRVTLLISLAVFLAALEGRVVFYSFHQYIRLTAPWSYLAVTIAMYGVAALVLLHFSGVLGEEVETAILGPMLMLSAAVGALAAGLPIWVLPAPLLAAAGLSMFYETRLLRDYALFWLGAMLTGGWFVWHHFWWLDIVLDGMHLRTISVLLLGAMAAAALVPGLAYASADQGLVVRLLLAPTLLVQAGLMCVVEEHLYAGDHEETTFGLHPMYPAFLVAATSVLGLLAARRLAARQMIGEVISYLLQCAYLAKLVMLALPEAKLVIPTLGLLLAVTPPLMLQRGAPDAHRRRRLAPWLGALAAAAVLLAVAAARFALFDITQFLLDRRPSEALMAGILVIAASAGCFPLVQRYYSHSASAKRTLLLAASSGLLLAIMRPPLPIQGGAECPRLPFGLCPRLWNEAHTPEHEEDDVAIWGEGLRRREHYPLWLLVGAVFFGLAALTQPAHQREAVALRLGQAAASAAMVAGYLALEFFPDMPLLQALILGSALVVALFLVLLALPTRGGPVVMPALSLLWAASFVLAMAVGGVSSLPALPEDAERLFPDGELDVDLERRQALKSAVMAVFAAEALLLAFALKLRVTSALAGVLGTPRPRQVVAGLGMAFGASLDQAAGFLGQCMPTTMLQPGKGRPMLKGAGGIALQRLSQDGLGWVPTLGNVVAFSCFGLCLALNQEVTGGAAAAALLLAPLLLLLSQDPLLLRGLEPQRRYFPPALALAGQLAASAAWTLLSAALSLDEGSHHLGPYAATGWFLVKNGVLLALALPTQADLLIWLWSGRHRGVLRVLAFAPLNLIVLALTDLDSLQILAGWGLAAAAVQAVQAQQVAAIGARII